MRTYQLTDEAALDLIEAYNYLGEQREEAAERWRETIVKTLDHLAAWPNTGHIREELAPAWLRFWPVGSHLIIYDPIAEPLTIIAVLHGAQDVAGILTDRL